MYIQSKGNSITDAEETVVKGKRMINVASIWIIVIFTVIAVMLFGIFMLVYSSIRNQEANSTLREEASILSDNADYQIMTPMRTEPVRRLFAKEGLTETIQSVSLKGEADSTEIQKMSEWCASACAAIPTCDRVLLYFPEAEMAVGSDGVHFIGDKKYTVRKSAYSFLLKTEPEDITWLRQPLAENGEEIPYIICRPHARCFSGRENADDRVRGEGGKTAYAAAAFPTDPGRFGPGVPDGRTGRDLERGRHFTGRRSPSQRAERRQFPAPCRTAGRP